MEFTVVLLDGRSFQTGFDGKDVTGQKLLSAVFNHCNLREERQYFGLFCGDAIDGGMNWLEPTHVFRKRSRWTYQLGVRFYPKHPDVTLNEDNARQLLCCQVKLDLLSGKLACKVETHAMLDSLIVQSEMGDWQLQTAKSLDFLHSSKNFDLVAPSFFNSGQNITESSYLKLVLRYYKQHGGLCRSDAISIFLAQLRFVPWYGYVVYPLATSKTNEVCSFIGLSDDGIALFQSPPGSRTCDIGATKSFRWNELAYCDSSGNCLLLGYYNESRELEEVVLKVSKGRDVLVKSNQAERIAKQIVTYKQVLLSPQHAFYGSRKMARKRINSAVSARELSNTRRMGRRLSSLSMAVRRHSIRRKLEISPSVSTHSSD